MSYETQRAAVEARMRDNWSATALTYEEVKYDPIPGIPWTKIWIIPGQTDQITLGGAGLGFRSIDIIQVDINVPAEQGVKIISGYADTAIAIFKGQSFSGITIFGIDIFRDKIDGWLKWSIRFTCQRDES